MWELDHKEVWALKNWCFQIVVLEKTLERPLDCKEIKLVNPEGNQPWIFTGRIFAKAETPILWPPDAKSRLVGKDPDAGKDWEQEEKGMTEDEMDGWHHWLNGVWANFRGWWRTGKLGVLQLQGVVTEPQEEYPTTLNGGGVTILSRVTEGDMEQTWRR